MDFDFLDSPQKTEAPLAPSHPQFSRMAKMTTKQFAQAVLDVFEQLGGTEWLLSQALIDPKGYMAMLGKMIPKSIDAADLQGLSITLVNQYVEGADGRSPQMKQCITTDVPRSPALPASVAMESSEAPVRPGGGPAQLGQPSRTATGGNPVDAVGGHGGSGREVEVIDVF